MIGGFKLFWCNIRLLFGRVMFCSGLGCWIEVCCIDVGICGGIICNGLFFLVEVCGIVGGIFGSIMLDVGFKLLLGCNLMLFFEKVMFCIVLGCLIMFCMILGWIFRGVIFCGIVLYCFCDGVFKLLECDMKLFFVGEVGKVLGWWFLWCFDMFLMVVCGWFDIGIFLRKLFFCIRKRFVCIGFCSEGFILFWCSIILFFVFVIGKVFGWKFL